LFLGGAWAAIEAWPTDAFLRALGSDAATLGDWGVDKGTFHRVPDALLAPSCTGFPYLIGGKKLLPRALAQNFERVRPASTSILGVHVGLRTIHLLHKRAGVPEGGHGDHQANLDERKRLAANLLPPSIIDALVRYIDTRL
jgi:hypothetical protein